MTKTSEPGVYKHLAMSDLEAIPDPRKIFSCFLRPAARHPRSMEPLLPKAREARLSELTFEILRAGGRLTGQAHSRVVLERVADLVREMNCYSSNLIEGHKTTPREIERALKRDFADDETQRDNQELNLAHIAVGRLMEEQLAAGPVDVCAPEYVCWLHREFYSRLPDRLHRAKTTGGRAISMPGARFRMRPWPGSVNSFSIPCATRSSS